jgi:putative hydrolase of the HAD superfamily
MTYTTLLLDLDDTVYPPGNGLWEAIAGRIERYMHERLGLSLAEIPALREDLHTRFGTTLRGLVETQEIDELEYLAFVHDIPLERYLHPNPATRAALEECSLRKLIFTNADRAHATRVLSALGLNDLIEETIDILDIRPYCKPMPQAYQIALRKAGISSQECIFLDDSQRNLQAAQREGITTIYVNTSPPAFPNGLWIKSLAELPDLFPSLGIQKRKLG